MKIMFITKAKQTEYYEAFRLLINEYYDTPRHWEHYKSLKELVEKASGKRLKEKCRKEYGSFNSTTAMPPKGE